MAKGSVDAKELERFMRELRELQEDWDKTDVVVKCRSTGERSGSDNAALFEEHRSSGRDPLFVDSREHNKLVGIIEDAIAEGIEASGQMVLRAAAAADVLGRLLVEWFQDHITDERSEGGRMRQLAPSTQRLKNTKYPGQPVLVRTGQLLRSLYYEVTRRG